MWNPFKSVKLKPVTVNHSDTIKNNPDIKLSPDVEKAQLRSLKAKTEITMIYEQLARKALLSMKGQNHASSA